MVSRFTIFFTILSCLSNLSIGQVLDNSFEMPLLVKQADIQRMEYLENGKILLGGRIDFYEDTNVNHLILLNEDGTLDETFNHNSDIGVVRTFHVLPNNEIVVGTGSHLYLMSSDGNVTNSVAFAEGDDLKQMVVADGYIWIGLLRNNTSFIITRRTLNLQVDGAFQNAVFSSNVLGLAAYKGKLLVSGFYLELGGVAIDPIVRLNSNGTIDETFELNINVPVDYGSIENLLFKKIIVGEDDKILVQSNGYNGVLKLEENGSQDMGFSFDPINLRHGFMEEIHLDASGNIYVVGYSNPYNNNAAYHKRIAKYDYNGYPDSGFQYSILSEKGAHLPALEVNDAGDILLANVNNLDNRYGLNKLQSDGILDIGFAPQVGTYGVVDVAEIKDDKFVIAGDFNRLGQFTTNDVAILNLDGSVDDSFQHTGNLEREPSDIGFYDGNIYLASKTEVHKFEPNGELDLSFNSKPEFLQTGFPVEWFCSNIHIQEDGKIVASSANGVFRMLANGDPDPSYGPFYPSIGTTAFDSDMEADGQVVFGGHFDEIDGASFEDIARINPDGTFDDSFQVERDASLMYGPGITAITSISNEETMVFGYFDRFGGFETPRNMVKLDENGKVDERFLQFLNLTFTAPANGFGNYTSFRGGFIVAAYNDYFIMDNEFVFNYELFSFNKSGIFQSQFELPVGYQASQEIIPLVVNNNDMILISKFFVEGEGITSGIRVKINDLPRIIDYEDNLTVDDTGLDLNPDYLEVDDADNVYPDDFTINAYGGDHFTVSGNTIIPESGFNGIIQVPVTVTEGSNESNYVLIPMIVGTGLSAGVDDTSLEIYPNPTSDVIEVVSNHNLEIVIHDMSGNRVKVGQTNSKIDLSGLEDGIYIVKMTEADGTVYSSKVIKQ